MAIGHILITFGGRAEWYATRKHGTAGVRDESKYGILHRHRKKNDLGERPLPALSGSEICLLLKLQ